MKAQRLKAPGLRGIHVFWIVTGFFAVSFAVNGFFIARAVGTFPGEDVKNSYVQGNDYNATLALHAQQMRLGWSAEAGFEGGARAFVFRLKDAAGKPVSGVDAALRWRWIGRDADERTLALHERAPGEYAGDVEASGPGRLAVVIEVRKSGETETAFVASKTLVTP